MKIIILGAGEIGTTLAIALAQEGNEITLIDQNRALLDEIRTRADLRLIQGNGAYPSVLEQANAADADMLVALTENDETNLIACQVARTMFEIPMRIARAQAREYLENEVLFKALPVTRLICPEKIASGHIERLIRHPGVLHLLDFVDGLVQLAVVRVPQNSSGGGAPIRNLRRNLPDVDMHVAALYRDSKALDMSDPNLYLRPGDEVFVLAAPEHMKQIIGYLRHKDLHANRKIMIAGGGSVGTMIALSLAKNGQQRHRVTLLERDEERAKLLPSLLGSDFLVLHADATDKNLLVDENIDQFDMFCAVTNRDEINILAAMQAKRLGAGTTLALINRPTYTTIVAPYVDIIVSPQQDTLGELLTHTRRGDILAVHSMHLGSESMYSGSAEALETKAHPSAIAVGQPIGKLPLPDSVDIGALVRDRALLFPDENSVIEPNDHVVLFVGDKRQIRDVERLFQVSPTSF